MSRVDDLILELAPCGVPFYELSDNSDDCFRTEWQD